MLTTIFIIGFLHTNCARICLCSFMCVFRGNNICICYDIAVTRTDCNRAFGVAMFIYDVNPHLFEIISAH